MPFANMSSMFYSLAVPSLWVLVYINKCPTAGETLPHYRRWHLKKYLLLKLHVNRLLGASVETTRIAFQSTSGLTGSPVYVQV